RNIELSFKSAELPEIMLDENQITLAVNNLLSNALKYSPDNSLIIIKTEKVNNMAELSVIDSGIGIASDELDKIFDRFYRSKDNKKHNIYGTGLGLSIVKKIIEVHGGEVSLKSTYGEGSTFCFTLPLTDQE
ncbi:MAG: ATP-binding protein, partial [Cyanobacteriota bacterium]